MSAMAVIFEKPEHVNVGPVELSSPGENDVVVDVHWSGISTGTERLLWSGRMPPFPGMGYPLVPGYESLGLICAAGKDAKHRIGDTVFVPGARCFPKVNGLFGGAASQLVVPSDRVTAIDEALGENGVLLALAATAHHAVARSMPEAIVGHGVLGRLAARVAVALGAEPPVVWEANPARRDGAAGYPVSDPQSDDPRVYNTIVDASGDSDILDLLVSRLSKGGEIVLAGFYSERLSFAFPPAFMREARIRIAAEWQPDDMQAVVGLVQSGKLSLDGLITHRCGIDEAATAYQTAFNDPSCLKMVLDWRSRS